ncbi:glycosyltransferase family 2 protein [Lewinella sp. LCG006]|uniref:glycosyltransferase n=1 Tax=Lewinella sp. LCG006 TaxID=3231911 RepID=UPI0034610EB2
MNKIISVIIPHYNNLVKLDSCLTALFCRDYSAFQIEYIVVDNGSTISLAKIKEKHTKVTWLLETSIQSPYPCRNKGIQHARGDIIVLLDSNCVPLENFFELGLKSLQDGNDVVGGQLRFIRSNSLTSRYDQLYSTIRPTTNTFTSLPGGCLFVSRLVFNKINLFLPCVRSLGDIEWTTRAYQAGFNLSITDQPIVSYQAKEWIPFCKKMIRLGRGKKEIYINNGGNLFSFYWGFNLLKSFLPPNPSFVKRMNNINRHEGTQLSLGVIFIFCWITKLLRGIGMFFSRVKSPRAAPKLT